MPKNKSYGMPCGMNIESEQQRDERLDRESAKHFGTPRERAQTGAEEHRQSLDSMTPNRFNSQSPQQPPETKGDVKRDFERTVTADRRPTNDMDRKDYSD